MSKIIAVDFDNTLALTDFPTILKPNRVMIKFLINKQRQGNKLILWTCRCGDDLTAAVDWCKEQGLIFDAVNDNIPEQIELYGENSRKIYADVYIDDKNMPVITPTDWYEE